MTALIDLPTKGGIQQVRIFSLRGAHLLAMFARTKVAKEFRHWVLDVLEGEAEAPTTAKRKPKLLPNGLTGDQQDAIKALVKARVEELPESKRAKAAITCWSALKSKFGCTYKEIAPEQFTEAVSLVARVVLEGEWMGKSTAFSDIIGRPLTRIERWMVYTDFEGNEQYKPIPYDACVMTHRELIQAMVTPGDMPVSTEEMFEFAMAALANLKGRSDYQARQLKHLTDKKRQGGKQ